VYSLPPWRIKGFLEIESDDRLSHTLDMVASATTLDFNSNGNCVVDLVAGRHEHPVIIFMR
jgi:hypothetical protein